MKDIAVLVLAICLLWPTSCAALSMNVAGGSAGQLIRFAAREGNLNVVMDDGVDASVTIHLVDVPPREAISRVVAVSGLVMSQVGDTLYIGQGRSLAARLGSVHVIPIKYHDLEEMKGEVELYFRNKMAEGRPKGGRKKVPQGQRQSGDTNQHQLSVKGQKISWEEISSDKLPRVETDIETRSLLVYGTGEEAAEIRELVQRLDVPAKQVALEAKVVAVKKDEAEKLGVNWTWSKIPHDFTYDALLELMISRGKARVLSKPNIVTLQGREAVINIGGEVPVPAVSVTNTTTTTSIEYRPAGIILQCRPFVNDDGYIDSALHIEVSSPSYVKEMKAYSFQKRSVDTRVRLGDGETLVIGGLISKEEEKQFAKVPFLGDIPVLGQLFRSRSTKVSDEEIMIFITAQILQ